MKTSMFYAVGSKTAYTTKSNTQVLQKQYDDAYAVDGKTWTVNPETTWYVEDTVKLDNNDQSLLANNMWNIVNGNNFHSKIEYSIFNNGVFYSDDMKNDGYYPINFKLVGDSSEFTATKVNTKPFNVGTYSQYPLTSTEYINDAFWYGDVEYEGKQLTYPTKGLAQPYFPTDEELIDKINSNPNSDGQSYSLYFSLVWDVKTNKQVLLCSIAPIYFSVHKLSMCSDNQYYVIEPTRANNAKLIKFYILSASKIWILQPKITTNSLYYPGNINDRRYDFKSNSLVPDTSKPILANCFTLANGVFLYNSKYSGNQNFLISNYQYTPWLFSTSNKDNYEGGNHQDLLLSIGPFITDATLSSLNSYISKRAEQANVNDRTSEFLTNIKDYLSQAPAMALILSNYLLVSDKNFNLDNYSVGHSYYDGAQSFPQSGVPKFGMNPIAMYVCNIDGNVKSNALDYGIPFMTVRANYSDIVNTNIRDAYIFSSIYINRKANLDYDIFSVNDIIGSIDHVDLTKDFIYRMKFGSYNIYNFDRKYVYEEKPLFNKMNTSSEHFSKVRSVNDDIFLSDELDEILGLDRITDDEFISNILSTNPIKQNEYQSSLDQALKVDTEKIVNEQIDKLPDVIPQDKYLAKQDVLQTVKEFKDKVNNTMPEIQSYNDFKAVFMANVASESKIGMIGQLRIITANPDESDIYIKLKELNLSEEQINNYAWNLFDEFDSALSGQTSALIDAIDMTNEINIINSLVSSQVNELTNSIEQVSKTISGIQDKGKDELEGVYNSISNIFSSAGSVANSISTSTTQYINQSSKMIEQYKGQYDQKMMTRCINNATGYVEGFVSALMSDPYVALKQHAAYLRSRSEKISLKTSLLNGIIKGMDFIPKIPSMVIDGLGSMGNLFKSLIEIAFSGAVQAITIIDNIDKLVFISEQFLSKSITSYATIPTVYDEMFTPPDIDPTSYYHFKRKAVINLNKDLSLSTVVKDKLLETKKNPIIIDGQSYSYNDYNVDLVFGNSSGYYYPIRAEDGLPILKPVSSSSSSLLPDLTDFIPTYPQRGNLWLTFCKQIAYFDDNDTKNLVSELSVYVPLSIEMSFFYGSMIIAIAFVAGVSAMASAGLRGDILGAMLGGVVASTTATAANSYELYNIVNRRGVMNTDSEKNSVYSYFQINYDKYKKLWESKITPEFIDKNYIFVKTQEDNPLFVDASEFKKFFIKIKEIMFLIGNLTMLISASVMIGKLTGKITKWASNRKMKKSLKTVYQFENKKFNKEKETIMNELNDERAKIEADDSLSQEDKDKALAEKDAQIKEVRGYYDGKINLQPTTKAKLNGILASNWGIGAAAVSSSAGSISALSSVGNLTSNAISDITNQINKVTEMVPGIKDEMVDNSIGSDSQQDSFLNALTTASSGLVKLVTETNENTQIIKKYT